MIGWVIPPFRRAAQMVAWLEVTTGLPVLSSRRATASAERQAVRACHSYSAPVDEGGVGEARYMVGACAGDHLRTDGPVVG